MNTRETKHTDHLAKEAIWGMDPDDPGHLNQICTLLANEPTTAELVEAQQVIKCLAVTVATWISSRHLIEAAPRRQCPVTRSEIDQELRNQAS
jgi:hypothetical protein